jgi:3-hydroxyisobutyrate dehydrogenase
VTSNRRATVGFVGLGHMGGNMAARLLAAGYHVHGQALHRESAHELEQQGLHWHDTAREPARTVRG